MPAYGYSQIRNPQTNQDVLVPQLFPYARCSGEIFTSEIENWMKSKVIPEGLCVKQREHLSRTEEISKRIRNGETIFLSDLPSTSWEFIDYVLQNKSSLHGENVLLKIFSPLHENDEDIVWLSFVKEAMTSLATSDPQAIHFCVARKILKEKFNIDDSRASDLLARELVEGSHRILKFSTFQHRAFSKNPIDIEDQNDHIKDEQKGFLRLDVEFIDYLKLIGTNGAELAKEVEKVSLGVYQNYEKNNYSPTDRSRVWGLWVQTDEECSNLAFEYLAEIFWKDKCSRLWKLQINGYPALARPIADIIVASTSHKNKNFIEKEGEIICINGTGDPIITAPAIDPSMIALFKKGVEGFSSLTGHRLLRWQVKIAFNRWSSGEKDPRLIKIEGGYSKIAELINSGSQHDIARVKEILHAQAHGSFTFSNGSRGNMITLTVQENYKNNEPSKIQIVLGDMLWPDTVWQFKNESRLLVPIGDLPPLHGTPNSHASQAQLQLLIFRELSIQSVRLAEMGSILIPNERWKSLGYEAGLSSDKVVKIKSHWCEPDLFNCFLDRQGDEYKLASYFKGAQAFLENQGKMRIKNSEKAKKSKNQKKSKKS